MKKREGKSAHRECSVRGATGGRRRGRRGGMDVVPNDANPSDAGKQRAREEEQKRIRFGVEANPTTGSNNSRRDEDRGGRRR